MSTLGEVVGINTAMIQRAQGICFAVASNTAVFAVSEFIAHGRVRRAHIGIAAETVPLPRRLSLATGAGSRAIRVSFIEKGSPADAAGVLAGDLLLSLDGTPIEGADALVRMLNAERIGRATTLALLRGGVVEHRTVVPTERGGEGRRGEGKSEPSPSEWGGGRRRRDLPESAGRSRAGKQPIWTRSLATSRAWWR